MIKARLPARAGSRKLLALVVVHAMASYGCGGSGGDGRLPLTDEQQRDNAQLIVERYRVTLGVIESVVPCEISGELPEPSFEEDDNAYVGWHDYVLVTQSVERSWGPEIAVGFASQLMGAKVMGGYRNPELGLRGFYYAKAIEPADVTYSCGIDPSAARLSAGGYGYWGPMDVTIEEMEEYFDGTTAGIDLHVEPIHSLACRAEDVSCE